MTIICTQCKHSNPDDAEFCENCGAQLPVGGIAPVAAAVPTTVAATPAVDKMVCPNCQAPFAVGDVFCFNCGYDLRNEPANRPAGQAVAQPIAQPQATAVAATPAVAPAQVTAVAPAVTPPAAPDVSEDDWDKAFEGGDPIVVAQPPVAPTPTVTPPVAPVVSPPTPDPAAPTIVGSVPTSLKLNVLGPYGTEIVEWKGMELLLGRQDAKTRVFPHVNLDDGAASRRHLSLWKDETDGYFYAQDLESSNGSILNSKDMAPGEPLQLKDSDIIKIGTRYTIEVKIS